MKVSMAIVRKQVILFRSGD